MHVGHRMGQTPNFSYSKIRKKLKALNFDKIEGGKHEKWKHPDCRFVTFSRGKGDVGPTLLRIICSQAEISVKDFIKI